MIGVTFICFWACKKKNVPTNEKSSRAPSALEESASKKTGKVSYVGSSQEFENSQRSKSSKKKLENRCRGVDVPIELCKEILEQDGGFTQSCADRRGATKYPIVLVHGMGLLNPDDSFGTSFYGIRKSLNTICTKVFHARVSILNSNEVRAEQLDKQLRYLAKEGGYSKFHLLGHSQGSPTSRIVAKASRELVASVTSINGVNHGSPLASIVDKIKQSVPSPQREDLISVLNLVANIYYSQGRNDVERAFSAQTPAYFETFNNEYPDGVAYWSPEKAADCYVNRTKSSQMFFSFTSSLPTGDGKEDLKEVLSASSQFKQVYDEYKMEEGASILTLSKEQWVRIVGLGLRVSNLAMKWFLDTPINDGLVGRDSQRFGCIVGHFEGVDHFQIANTFDIPPKSSSLDIKVQLYQKHIIALAKAGH